MRKHRVLIVDDEAFVRQSLVELLESEDYGTRTASSATEALEVLGREAISAVVTDLSMPHGDGLTLLRRVADQDLRVPVILLTGVGTVADAVAAMKAGAYDFIQKPVEPGQFLLTLRRSLEHGELVAEVQHLRETVRDLRGPQTILGVSAATANVRALVQQVAPRDTTVLVTGESGTGKELVAAAIHAQSSRARKKAVRVNCAAVPELLFESEFFGHRRGAFTSAVSDRQGRVAEAEGGTLVLDELGTLPAAMQAKLLRVLESGEYQVVGESRTQVANVRVVAVTNEDLSERVRRGTFRADLFWRLNVFPISVPPLRERREDIPVLAEHFLALARGLNPAEAPATASSFSRESLDLLMSHSWPGNVRELRNLIERAVILAGNQVPSADVVRRALGAAASTLSADHEHDLNIRSRVESLERRLIEAALERTGGKRARAAALLGVDPRNLAYYLRKHGMTPEEPEAGEKGEA